MAIRDILQKQDEGFISLHDLLIKMTTVHGDTLQDAATLLYRLLIQAHEQPQWYATSLETGPCTIDSSAKGMAALHYVAINGQWMDSDDIPF
ncbi:hypothetical protein [Pseudoduganella namucuonensis]|uniref:Uncharacterized protein n=1 Tax=Pseudoduganella namucuonensis TaxID=1035707 RepID=A0A1I7M0M2_9BURK|nr:hypothetical protein [Pseudoduganella namucuonensis]SFV15476.1 hypothetical protein SAMN05216552_104624 [Pseudoduganella namucuonensis]